MTRREEIRPPSEEWIGVPQAAKILKRGESSVARIAGEEGIEIQRSHGRLWLRRDQVKRAAAARNQWISLVDASELTGYSPSVISRAVRAGRIEQRPIENRRQPGLSRKSVEAWAVDERGRRIMAAARRAAERDRAKPPPVRNGHRWMSVKDAAEYLGIGVARVGQLIQAEQLRATRKGSRVWLREDHVAELRTARAIKAAGLRRVRAY